ncbi:hypothetical protein DKY63_10310 [Pseudomonas putida]|uniref:Uncharacterized protein n=1 Tax=Pseudomonas putida TaxID=303 RepID=A0A2Z4RGU2_PSEPU|nr:hypothetical protein DKY63_10310 [Pseudomonas putida]
MAGLPRWFCNPGLIVPTLRVGTPPVTLCVTLWDAERPRLHSHAERGNDQIKRSQPSAAPTPTL